MDPFPDLLEEIAEHRSSSKTVVKAYRSML